MTRSAAWKLAPTRLLAKYPGACSPEFCSSLPWHCPSGAIVAGSTRERQCGRLQPRSRRRSLAKYPVLICRQQVRRPEYLPRPPSPKPRKPQLPPPPQLLASLPSSSRPARNPGPRSPPTAELSRPNFCPRAASARSEAGRKSSSGPETLAASTFDSTERRSIPAENTGRSRPLLLVLEESYRLPRHRLRRRKFLSFFSSFYRPP